MRFSEGIGAGMRFAVLIFTIFACLPVFIAIYRPMVRATNSIIRGQAPVKTMVFCRFAAKNCRFYAARFEKKLIR